MAALVRQNAVVKAVFPDAGAELWADATEIARLYRDLDRVSGRENPRAARLLACGRRKMAQKLMEEAGEIALRRFATARAGSFAKVLT